MGRRTRRGSRPRSCRARGRRPDRQQRSFEDRASAGFPPRGARSRRPPRPRRRPACRRRGRCEDVVNGVVRSTRCTVARASASQTHPVAASVARRQAGPASPATAGHAPARPMAPSAGAAAASGQAGPSRGDITTGTSAPATSNSAPPACECVTRHAAMNAVRASQPARGRAATRTPATQAVAAAGTGRHPERGGRARRPGQPQPRRRGRGEATECGTSHGGSGPRPGRRSRDPGFGGGRDDVPRVSPCARRHPRIRLASGDPRSGGESHPYRPRPPRRTFVRGRHGSPTTPGSSRIRSATVTSAPRSSSSCPARPGADGAPGRWPVRARAEGRGAGAAAAAGACRAAGRARAAAPARTGLTPLRASYRTSASENRSADAPAGSPCACSGAMYATVPITSPVRVSESPPSTRATPKSVSRADLRARSAALGDQHVGRLDVAVDHAVGVGMGERVAQRDPDLHDVAIRQPTVGEQASSVVPWTSSETR